MTKHKRHKKRKVHKYPRATRKAMKHLFIMTVFQHAAHISNYSRSIYLKQDRELSQRPLLVLLSFLISLPVYALMAYCNLTEYAMFIITCIWLSMPFIFYMKDSIWEDYYKRLRTELQEKITHLYSQVPTRFVNEAGGDYTHYVESPYY